MGLREKGFLFILMCFNLLSQITLASGPAPQIRTQAQADSLLSTMTLEEKIGQLLMLPVYSNRNERYYQDIDLLIDRYHIGGLLFFQGSPTRQRELIGRFQQNSKIKLFIGMDAEWGLAMRLDSIVSLPRSMTLGAVRDNRLIYNVGAEMARQFKVMDMHINFAPVLDVNNNPDNPVINVRAFGEDPEHVSSKGIALVDGMQDNGVIAVAKHFPGHGDTNADSHHALPIIRHNRSRLDSIELFPFKNAIQAGLKGMMIAHLSIPALDSRPGMPATLSNNIVNGVLKRELNYSNLVFTDAMNMQGVTSTYPEGRRELEAFLAGNDIILMPVNVPAVFRSFREAIKAQKITESSLTERVRKILYFKLESGAFSASPAPLKDVVGELNKNIVDLNYRIFEEATTLVNNSGDLIPFHLCDTIRFASLSLYGENEERFKQMADRYASIDHFSYGRNTLDAKGYAQLFDRLSGYEVVMVSIHDLNNRPDRRFGISQRDIQWINQLNQNTNVVLIVYGTPYSLKYFEGCEVVMCAYEDNIYAQETVAQQLFGAIAIKGRLPVSVSPGLKAGAGIDRAGIGRLGYSTPSRERFNGRRLALIDTIVQQSIHEKMIPGAQLLIAKNGRIVLEKNYGALTYDNMIPVSDTTLYDLASVTKVAGTVQILMMLVDHGFIDPDKKISFYLRALRGTNKEDLIIRDILSHQAGLYPYYPYWTNTIDKTGSFSSFYSPVSNASYSVEIRPGMYTRTDLQDSLWNWMVQSDLIEREDTLKPYEYVYSDIGFYLIQRLIEEVTGEKLNDFLEAYFFTPLGLQHIGYRPKNHFPDEQIAPSTVDNIFRKAMIRGNVHDEIASIYGGVAGHAGLFSNAYDLAVIMQMNLQNGYYGGTQYISPEVLESFTGRQYTFNRRGMGWDKPQVIGYEYNPATYLASKDSYGHSGFTGTYVWVDPAYDLVYVFLSNRTYPDNGNKKLIDSEVRKRIQTVIYSSLINN